MDIRTARSDQEAAAARQWDQAAAGWNAHSPLIREWLRLATDAMISCANISPGMRVLDVAAGAGDQTLDVATRVGPEGAVLATDFSPAILAYAAANASAAGLRNVDTCVASAERLPLDDASFDAAICRLGLMLMPRPAVALREIRRILKPGARLAALVFSDIGSNPCLAIMMRVAAAHAGATPGDPYRPGSLVSLGKPGLLAATLGRAGFSHVVTTRMPAPMVLPSLRHYTDFVRDSGAPVVALLAHLSPSARAQAWAEIEDQLGVFSTPNGWSGPNELLLATGVT
ncbi:MAG: class I SAM-dependent methyltransferase [Paracoccaceae bacterium]